MKFAASMRSFVARFSQVPMEKRKHLYKGLLTILLPGSKIFVVNLGDERLLLQQPIMLQALMEQQSLPP
jgi:hypothetical protein